MATVDNNDGTYTVTRKVLLKGWFGMPDVWAERSFTYPNDATEDDILYGFWDEDEDGETFWNRGR